MTTVLTERGGRRITLPEGKGDKYLVRLMGWEPGAEVVEGSSADYPVAAIKRDFPEAFPPGTRMRANHDGLCEAGGDIRRIMAKTVDTPWPEEDGMYAHAMFAEGDYSKFVAEFGDVIGLSISAGVTLEMEPMNEGEDGEPTPKRSERGAVIVERFLTAEESPYNSVDVVEAPGADGRIVARAVEAARAIVEHMTIREAATFAKGTRKTLDQTSEAAPQRNTENEENSMETEEMKALAAEAAKAAVAEYAESLRPAAPEQPTIGELAESVVTAGLSEAGRKSVYERLTRGETLESAIDAEKTREADIQAEVDRRVEAALAERKKAETDVFEFGFTSDDKTGAPLGTEDKGRASESIDAEFEAAFAD